MTTRNLRNIIVLTVFSCVLIFLGLHAAFAASIWTPQTGVYVQYKIPPSMSNAYTLATVTKVPATWIKQPDTYTKLVSTGGAVKYQKIAVVLPPVGGQTGLMPSVDISKNMIPAIGYDTLRVKPTTEIAPVNGGAFRIVCAPSHMSNDDPIVYPNQQGRAHHHTFYGNTSINYATDVANIDSIGNSTCKGGIMNRSAYWVPSMIDTKTNAPVLPKDAIFYYKKDGRVPYDVDVTAPPKGLRIIAGNMHAKTATESRAAYTCLPPSGSGLVMTGWHKNIQICPVGWEMQMSVSFPMCWDGVNLDSPNHQDHMAYNSKSNTSANKCPASHPVAIPHITLNLNWVTTATTDMSTWRLSSDNYARDLPAGYSSHADWINGWNPAFLEGIVKNCLNQNRDCHAHLLGDGRMFN